MKYLPWLMAGVLGYLFVQRGGLRSDYGGTVDGLTGEPMAPYSGKGRPRSFNSLETRRIGVLWRELHSELDKTEKSHLWTTDKARAFSTVMRGELNTQLNNQRVCVIEGTTLAAPMRVERSQVKCDGEIVKFSLWMNRVWRHQKALEEKEAS
jgi:hypothetical protein